MNNNAEARGHPTEAQVNPPDIGATAPGAAADPVRNRDEDPNRRDPTFRARQTNQPGRTSLALVAQRLVANQDATPSWKNERPFINVVPIFPERLRNVFELILYPIVYGNYRAIGTRTCDQAIDANVLNNIITTVSVNAVLAAYAVMYTKASAISTGYTVRFGGVPDIDKFRFPALITHLINSLGPIQRDRDPYRCLFIPMMNKIDVDALRTQPGYDPLLEEMFTTGVLKTRNVLVTDVDINAKESSHWWTLYVQRQHNPFNVPGNAVQTANQALPARGSRGHTTVYSPIHFHDRDSAVLLGGLCLVETLYNLPGPLQTSRIGPFISPSNDNRKESIPPHLRDEVAINVHLPVVLLQFTERSPISDSLTNAEVHAIGGIQSDVVIQSAAADSFTNVRPLLQTNHNLWLQHVQEITNPTPTGTTPGSTRPNDTPRIVRPGRPDDPAPGASHLALRYCTVIYFDHVLYNEFALDRIGSVITEASRLNTQVQTGDEISNRL